MAPNTSSVPPPKKALLVGRILTGLALLFLLWDSAIKFTSIAPVLESFERLGFRPGLAPRIGMIELGCVMFYLIPRTAFMGAALLTAYLGGAVACQLRIGEPLFSHILFPIYVGLLVWGGIYLREPRLRAVFPFRN